MEAISGQDLTQEWNLSHTEKTFAQLYAEVLCMQATEDFAQNVIMCLFCGREDKYVVYVLDHTIHTSQRFLNATLHRGPRVDQAKRHALVLAQVKQSLLSESEQSE